MRKKDVFYLFSSQMRHQTPDYFTLAKVFSTALPGIWCGWGNETSSVVKNAHPKISLSLIHTHKHHTRTQVPANACFIVSGGNCRKARWNPLWKLCVRQFQAHNGLLERCWIEYQVFLLLRKGAQLHARWKPHSGIHNSKHTNGCIRGTAPSDCLSSYYIFVAHLTIMVCEILHCTVIWVREIQSCNGIIWSAWMRKVNNLENKEIQSCY